MQRGQGFRKVEVRLSASAAVLGALAAALGAGTALAQTAGTRADMRHCLGAAEDYVYVASPRCQKGDREITYQEYLEWSAGRSGAGTSDAAPPAGTGAAVGPAKGVGALVVEPPPSGPRQPATLPDMRKDPGPPKEPDGGHREPTVEAGIVRGPYDAEPSGSGTGFYVDTQGHLLTNAHVVEECTEVGILREDEIAPTRVLAVDPDIDLALIEAEPTGGPYAVFRSTEVEIGEPAFAVGFPLLGVLTSINMTSGIISSLTGPAGYDGVIQTTAAVQPGNSGGPLVDESGSVIGVVFATGDPTTTQNLGWAIKSELAVRFLGSYGVGVAQRGTIEPIGSREVAKGVGAFTVPLLCYE